MPAEEKCVVVNQELGEVELKSRFDDSPHVFSFSPNNLARVEEAIKRDVSDVFLEMSSGRLSVRTIRTIMQLTYVVQRGGKAVTAEQAGDLLNAIGYKPFVEAFSSGIKWMKVGMDENGDAANPTVGSGESSA